MAKYTRSSMLGEIANGLIHEMDEFKHLDNPNLRIAYQFSDQEKSGRDKIIYADVEKVKDKYKAFMPYEFVVTFYLPNVEGLDNEHLCRLMYHELKHIGFDGDDKFWTIPHNLEDFRECIDKWGVDWISTDKPTEDEAV